MRHSSRHSGFTLLEMSIVMAIIGLITGGIIVGQTLVRSSELQSVLRESTVYVGAVNTFQGRYGGLPGDIANATSVWGKDATKCSSALGPAATPGTCNGNGDGKITTGWNGATASWPEMFRFWQQLSFAGLIKGKYTGVTGPSTGAEHIGGTNAPMSRWRNATYGLWYANTSDALATTSSMLYGGFYGTFLILGRDHTTGHPWGSVFTPNDANSIDAKADDGRPGLGKIVSNNNTNAESTGGCGDSATAATAYCLTNDSAVTCILMFRNNF